MFVAELNVCGQQGSYTGISQLFKCFVLELFRYVDTNPSFCECCYFLVFRCPIMVFVFCVYVVECYLIFRDFYIESIKGLSIYRQTFCLLNWIELGAVMQKHHQLEVFTPKSHIKVFP